MTDDNRTLDARLSAYLDGELDAAGITEIERLIDSDPQVAARLEALATARADFETASHEIDDVPMSASLATMLDRLESRADEDDETSEVIAFPAWRQAASFFRQHRAIAASVAVAAGAMTLQTAVPAQVSSIDGLPANGALPADSGVGRVLEASASGSSQTLEDGLTVTPRFTFASGEGYCRVADTVSNGAQSRFVACREKTGWQVAIATFTAASGGSPDAPYRTASQAGSESVEAFLDSTMTDPPLGAEEESELIKTGWSGQPLEEGE